MKRIYFLVAFALISITSFAQTYFGYRLIAKDSIMVNGKWVYGFSSSLNSTDSNDDKKLPTAKAVADWVRTQTSSGSINKIIDTSSTHGLASKDFVFANTFKAPPPAVPDGVIKYNFKSGDSTTAFTIVAPDGSTSFTKDDNGLRLTRSSNTTNPYDNRLVFTKYGQTWTNNWKQTLRFVPNFDPSSVVRQIGFGITSTADNQLWVSLGLPSEYFGFMVKLGADASTSGYQGAVSSSLAANDVYGLSFTNGLKWAKGDLIELTVEQTDRNEFNVTITDYTSGSVVKTYLNYPLANGTHKFNYSYHAGYFSIYFNGGDFSVHNYTIDPLTAGVQLVWVGNSIDYGYGLENLSANNNLYSTYNLVKNSIPVKSVLLARPGVTSGDMNFIINEILLYKPRFVVLNGMQTNDWFVSSDPAQSEATYIAFVKKLKAFGINVIHITPAPRGNSDGLYGTFHPTLRAWMLSAFKNDMVIDDFTQLLQPGSTNQLNSSYYSEGDGTHLNTAGHAVVASAFIAQAQFNYYKGSVARVNTDTLIVNNRTTLSGDSLTVNAAYTLFNSGANNFINGIQIISPNSLSFPINIQANTNGFERIYMTNASNTPSASVGFYVLNDLGRGFQMYTGSSTNGFFADGTLIRGMGANGMKLTTDLGRIAFELQSVINNTGDTSHYVMSLDGNGVMIHRTEVKTYDSTLHKIIMAGPDGRLYLSSTTIGGVASPLYAQKSASYTLTATDGTIEVIATGTTQTLPTAVGRAGKIYTIILTAGGTATVATTSSQNIGTSTTYSLTAANKYVTVQSNNANWMIIGSN